MHNQFHSSQPETLHTRRTIIFLAALVFIAFALSWAWRPPAPPKPLARMALGDGRILQVEATSYGTNHHVGNPSSEFLWRFHGVLPNALLSRLAPKNPEAVISGLGRPALVVWVDAVSAEAGTNMDCQGIRVELVDEYGQHFGESTLSWFGGDKFWRVGHVFSVYPRTAGKLTLEVVTWKGGKTNQAEILNPYVVQPMDWKGLDLPQREALGDLTVVLTGLRLRTNGLPAKSWETRSLFWEPIWEFRRGPEKISGWDEPEWFAEDATGNRGQELGTHQSVLRYSATFYPSATNLETAQLLATLPQTSLTNPPVALWWNQTIPFAGENVTVLGFFPPGNYVFQDGQLLTNAPVTMGRVFGGAPSGWTGQSVVVNPMKIAHYHGHYSVADSIIYVRAPNLPSKNHLAMRLRDEQGRFWLATLEPQGAVDGVYAFLVKLPPEVNRVTPELVLLKPVEAEFMVNMRSAVGR